MYVIKSETPDVLIYDNGATYQFKDGIYETSNVKVSSRLKELGYEVSSTDGTYYSEMSDNEIAAIAEEKGIDIEGKTKRQVINALKRLEEENHVD